MKRGFTIVELLAVITIIGMVLLIVVPSVSNTLSNSDTKGYETLEETLKYATSLYINDYNLEKTIKNSTSKCGKISYNTLKSENLIKEITTANGTKCTSSYVVVRYDATSKKIIYSPYLDCGSVYKTPTVPTSCVNLY